MKKKINTMDLIALGAAILTLIGAALRTVALLTAFDADVGYFSESALITYLDRALLLAAIVFGTVVLIATPKDKLSASPAPITVWSTFSSAALGFIFAIFGVLFLILHLPKPAILVCITSAGALASAIYFIYEAIRPDTAGKRIGLGLFPVISLVGAVFVENFDFLVALNSPEKLLATVTFAVGALLIVQRLKFSAGNPTPRFELWCAYLVAFLGAYFAVGGIVATCVGVLDDPKYLVYYLLSVGLSIYAFIDLYGRLALARLADAEIISEPDTTI